MKRVNLSHGPIPGAALIVPLLLIAAAPMGAAREGLFVTVSTDRALYHPGETLHVVVSATVSGGTPAAGIAQSRIEIEDGAGVTVIRDTPSIQADGRLAYDYLIPADASPGYWEIEVKVSDARHRRGEGDHQFEVSSDAPCADLDFDGYADAACGGSDCNDRDPAVHPGAAEVCGDGIDQDCRAGDLPCEGGPHATIAWTGPGTCLGCHEEEARQVHSSVMYQWQGDTPFMVNGEPPQGKAAGAVNSYCINILGNWGGCGSCHLGLGARPEPDPSPAQLENIDCLLCHQQAYRRTKVDGVFVPDEAAMSMTMDQAAQTVHRPERFNCLQCHAKAGGGDAVKRGDLALASAHTSDRVYDVHLAITGANLRCQDCHTFTEHHVAGKGSDLRPTDSAVQVECSTCHGAMVTADGHEGEDVDRHLQRVACQTCHIPVYAKNASDSAASEATEVHRTWLSSHATQPPFHPASEKQNNLAPVYRFWNRYSDNYLLGDVATIDPATGRHPTSRPVGNVADPASRLYPFKYKTAQQPIANSTAQLIALDTSVYFATADPAAATERGLMNMGLDASEPYSWIETDTFQLLNHQVSPSSMALACNDCHGSAARMDLQGELGYAIKASSREVCSQCHGFKSSRGFRETHNKHVKDKLYDCSWCHGFSRPERNLRKP